MVGIAQFFEGGRGSASVRDVELKLTGSGAEGRVVGKAKIALPANTSKAELLILCEPTRDEPAPLVCRARVSGRSVEVDHLPGRGGRIPRHRRHGFGFRR